jgi:hypothetical protein
MNHKLDSGYAKYIKDRNKGRIKILHYDEEEIQIKVPASKKGKYYIVDCSEGFWRCECFNWNEKWKSTPKVGSYCCKHIEEAHYEIARLKGVFQQSTLVATVKEIEGIQGEHVVLTLEGIPNYKTGNHVRMNGIEYRVNKIWWNKELERTEMDLVRVDRE